MSENAITVNVDEYLAVNKYEVDEGNPHITLADDLDGAEFDKLVKVCPAALTSETKTEPGPSITPAAWNAAPVASCARAPS